MLYLHRYVWIQVIRVDSFKENVLDYSAQIEPGERFILWGKVECEFYLVLEFVKKC